MSQPKDPASSVAMKPLSDKAVRDITEALLTLQAYFPLLPYPIVDLMENVMIEIEMMAAHEWYTHKEMVSVMVPLYLKRLHLAPPREPVVQEVEA